MLQTNGCAPGAKGLEGVSVWDLTLVFSSCRQQTLLSHPSVFSLCMANVSTQHFSYCLDMIPSLCVFSGTTI